MAGVADAPMNSKLLLHGVAKGLSLAPVSYTHLDVYKRQDNVGAIFKR